MKCRYIFRIRSDHNIDQSISILKYWIGTVKDDYHSIYTEFEDDAKSFPGKDILINKITN